MAIRLVVTAEDAQLERLLVYLKGTGATVKGQLSLLDSAGKWLQASLPENYGVLPNPANSAEIHLGDA